MDYEQKWTQAWIVLDNIQVHIVFWYLFCNLLSFVNDIFNISLREVLFIYCLQSFHNRVAILL